MKNLQQLIQNLRKGEFADDLSEHIANVSKAVQETQKPGKITITIKVKPTGGNAIMIEDKIVSAAPEGDPMRAVFYVDDEGNLERNDPNQRELPLRAVEGGKKDEPVSKAV